MTAEDGESSDMLSNIHGWAKSVKFISNKNGITVVERVQSEVHFGLTWGTIKRNS